ncbi:hypothetical protein [Variovorax sp. KK3]|uniref:hypothetical protein n=1 Tax=Variovorax sp. KK3 TaxID=1855728 RepID=UPI00097BF03E|nr:hypothetical protein [Variovorax sp. KK3]
MCAWLRCDGWFGLATTWRPIGYVDAAHASGWGSQLDAGLLRVERAIVCSSAHAPGWPVPVVSIQIDLRP